MGDLVRYWYAALFLFASAYTLYDEGHVRVDIVYAGLRERTKGYANFIGTILLGLSTCWAILLFGLDGKQALINMPILNFEVSPSRVHRVVYQVPNGRLPGRVRNYDVCPICQLYAGSLGRCLRRTWQAPYQPYRSLRSSWNCFFS